MKEKELNGFIRRLKEEKARLVEQIDRLEETGLSGNLRDSTGELSLYDNHPADSGDELFERSKDIALRDNAHVLIERVERALGKAADGTYGYCDICCQQISAARLRAIPWASECIECQTEEDAANNTRRPLEESIISPPFQRTFLDDSDSEFVGFDGEDALQAVLRYGSSDSPQDLPGTHDYEDLFPNSNEPQGIVDPADEVPNELHVHRAGETTKKKTAL